MQANTVLVTGAAGFIGSHTVERLLRRGSRVIGLDNFNDYYDPARKRANVEEVAELPEAAHNFELIEGDIRDRSLLSAVLGRGPVDCIVHLAAMAGVRASADNPWLYYDVNLTGTLNLLEAAREHGNPNFVFASTSSAYGNTKIRPFVETDAADRPLAPYPASKRAAELLGHSYHHLYGIDFTALRFFTVYGPRGRPDMMAYKVCESVHRKIEIPLYNQGKMHRDWTYVDDIVSGVVAAADRRLGFEIINLGRGEPVLLKDFIDLLEKRAAGKAQFRHEPMMSADVDYTFADISQARSLLDYDPRVSVEEGVDRFYAWYSQRVATS